jgi:hypothetical protein
MNASTICAIVLSYKRPQNIQRIVDTLLNVRGIAKVLISNNHPQVDLTEWLKASDPRVQVINQTERTLCIKRFELAMTEKFDLFLCPDDDIFPSALQYEALLTQLMAQPERIHGLFGEIPSFGPEGFRLGGGITELDCEVDILNCCYAFTRTHLERMFELLKTTGIHDSQGAQHLDDIYLSFSGQGKPLCHNLGPFEKCPTSSEEGVATWLEDGFQARRLQAYFTLSQMGLSWSG